MNNSTKCLIKGFVAISIVLLFIGFANAFKVREDLNAIEQLEFRADEIYIPQTQVTLAEIINQLPNKDAWSSFAAQQKTGIFYFDPRSGRPVSFIYPYPIIPGTGENNHIRLNDLSNQLGYEVKEVNREVVKDLLLQHLRKFNNLIRINLNEIGEIRIDQIAEPLWHAHFRRQVNGIPVKDSTIAFTINHGNLVLWGLESWGDVNINTNPTISKETAIDIAFRHIGGKLATDTITKRPHLEIIPINSEWDGAVGKGYNYALVWVFNFKREGFNNDWEFVVDAHSGKLLSFLDKNMYAVKKIVGAIYPVSDDECCPSGCAATGTPAPYINTGFASPNDYTDYGGMYNYTSGTAVTTLDGRYVVMGTDSCGTISESSSTGDIDLGGTNGQHDCTVPSGHSAGDTFSSRCCAIEVTHLNREVASWLGLSWLNGAITCNVNINATCNAYYSGNTINFYRSGGGCRNTGEIAAVFDHEWGHAVDYNDTSGGSSPNESICDISGGIRLHTSCIGRGFFWTLSRGCGQWTNCPSNPGTSYGYNCNGYASASECCLECTGIREIDYMKHADTDPDTIQNFTCSICSTSGSYFGPCGREAHCEGVPPAMVGWDLVARDLQSAPFNLDKQSAFLIGEKIIWQGHNNVTNWYTCTCPSTVNACASTNAHPNWLAAEDDDGNINNGTPHASAIYAAMNRHGIACTTLSQTNSGCAGGPTTAATLTATPQNNSVALSWTSVPGAANYYVWRTEGVMGCDFGKVKIATVSTTSYTDSQAPNGRTYYYTVQAVGSNVNCLGPLSNCVSATPAPGPHASYQSDTRTDTCSSGGPGNNNGIIDPGETVSTTITIVNDGSGGLTNISGTLSTATSGVTIINNSSTYPNISSPGGTANSNSAYSYSVNPSFTCGADINFDLNLTYTEGSNATNFTHKVGQMVTTTIFTETWESGLTNWTTSGLWHLTTEAAQNCFPEPYPSSVTVAYYGQDSTCTYDTGAATSGNLDRTAAISGIASNSQLTFQFVNGNEGLSSYDISYVYVSPDGTTWTQVWTWAGTQQPTWAQAGPISLSSWAGQSIYLRFRFNSVDGTYNNYLGWAVDNINISGTSWQCNVCQQTSNPPGRVLNNLTVAKSGSDLVLNWQAPGGECDTTVKYSLYRGTLNPAGSFSYNHASQNCNITSTSTTIAQGTDSYYYLIVHQDASNNEGSYGLTSGGSQIPQGSSPCGSQNTTACN